MPIRLTRAVKALLIACFGLFVVQQTVDQFLGGNLLGWLGLVPSAFMLELRFWQVFTYAFLHGDVMHLFLNMLMLAFIGGEIETAWGTVRFLRYFFFCSISAGLFYLLLQALVWKGNVPMVGASGGIYGLLVAYGLIFGERVLLFMLLFPMKAKHFVIILAAVEFFTTVFSGRSGSALAGAAHLGGMAAGFAYLWTKASLAVVQRRKGQGLTLGGAVPKKKRKKSHLKLITNDDDDEVGKGPKTWH